MSRGSAARGRLVNPLVPMHGNRWRGDPEARAAAVRALEEGAILYLPERGFGIEEGEARLFSDEFPCPGAKSFSYDPCRAEVGGPSALRGAPAADRAALGAMMSRYARFCRDLCTSLLGEYGERLSLARTSFRPVEVAGRDSRGVKSDDTLLHVDSFPATPTAGRRILRVFCNVSPVGRSRVWHVGERFEDVAARFAPRLRIPWPGERTLLRMLGVTAGDRTPVRPLHAAPARLYEARSRLPARRPAQPCRDGGGCNLDLFHRSGVTRGAVRTVRPRTDLALPRRRHGATGAIAAAHPRGPAAAPFDLTSMGGARASRSSETRPDTYRRRARPVVVWVLGGAVVLAVPETARKKKTVTTTPGPAGRAGAGTRG